MGLRLAAAASLEDHVVLLAFSPCCARVSIEPRPDWQDILDVAASSLITDGVDSSARGAVGGMEPLLKALPLWASVVHVAPHRVRGCHSVACALSIA